MSLLKEWLPFLAPRYWTTWLGLALMIAFAKLPLRLLFFIGTIIGELVYWLMPKRRHITQTNIDLCFPELNEQARVKLVKKCFHSTGKSVLEAAYGWFGNKKHLEKITRFEGLEFIEQAQKENRPILLLSGHMCCIEVTGEIMADRVPLQVMYKHAKNRLFDKATINQRTKRYLDVVPRNKSRRLLKNLKNGMTTWYAPDQSFGSEDSVFAPFFGIPAATLTATSRLARFANAVVIPYFPYRLPNNEGYRLVIKAPLENFPSDSLEDDAARVNQVIEEAVRVAPEQYLWLHRRFHHRPEGQAQFY